MATLRLWHGACPAAPSLLWLIHGVLSPAGPLQVLIGIVSEEIKAQLKGVRSGNYPVVTADHTLVLNWNRQSTALLRKIAQDSHGCSKSLGK